MGSSPASHPAIRLARQLTLFTSSAGHSLPGYERIWDKDTQNGINSVAVTSDRGFQAPTLAFFIQWVAIRSVH